MSALKQVSQPTQPSPISPINSFSVRARQRRYVTYGLALAFVFGIALLLRVYFPHDNVFAGDWVRFQLNDPWYHMRHIENLVHHFPNDIPFDPYGAYPSGLAIVTAPFYDFLPGFFAWVLGAGSPSKGVIETVAAYFPAILGALVTIPVFFIGKELFGRKAGLLSAALIAILPGQFLMRTLLGFTDHHAAEILFSTLTILFLILAVKNARRSDVSFGSLRGRDWRALRKPLLYSLLTGIALGLYLLSWRSGAFFVFIIIVFAVLQYAIDHLRGRPTDYLCLVGVPAFLFALLMIAPFKGEYSLEKLQMSSLIIGILSFLALSITSSLMVRRNIGRLYYPIAIAALIGVSMTFLYLVDRSLFNGIINRMSLTFNPTGLRLNIGEVGGLSLSTAWEYFSACFYISLVSLVMILYLVIKEGAADKTLLFVWSLIALMAAFGQERLAYYLAVNVALLTAYLSWRLLKFAGFREATEEVTGEEPDRSATLQTEVEKPKLTKKAKRRKEKASKRRQEALGARILNARHVYSLIALIVVFFLVFYPNIGKAIDWANAFRGPFQYWHDALVWMEDNTPEPFSDTEFYYYLYEKPARGESYNYPESAYGVMSWWDFGYWITYIAHRIPNANPSGYGARLAGQFFTAQDESSANEMMDRRGSKYVIIDYLMAMPEVSRQSQMSGYFPAMIEWAGKDQSEFFEEYYVWNEGELQRIVLYYPAFYQSMCTRLFMFGGEEVIPDNSTWVISYIERIDDNGFKYKEITSDQLRLPTYEAAEEYLRIHGSDNYSIVGNDPFSCPVPLDRLEHYELVYRSPTYELASKLSVQFEPLETRHVPHIEIFEYLP